MHAAILVALCLARADDAKQIRAGYANIVACLAKKDVDGAAKYLLPEYRTDRGGTKATYVAEMKRVMSKAKAVEAKFHLQGWNPQGDRGTARVQAMIRLAFDEPNRKRHWLEYDEVLQDNWVRPSGAWRLRLTQSLKMTTRLDGKVFTLPTNKSPS